MSEVRLTYSPLKWITLSTAGLAGGIIVGRMVGAAVNPFVNATVVTFVVTCIVGLVLGGFQAAGLRSLEVNSFWWIAATFVGVGVGLALGVVVVVQAGVLLTGTVPNVQYLTPALRALIFLLLGLVTGGFTGTIQAFALRRAGWSSDQWAVMGAIGLATAFAVSSFIIYYSGFALASMTGGGAFVILSGLCYGTATSRLLGRVD